MSIYCKECGFEYTVKIDRKGNSGDLPIYCPFCRQKVTTIHDKLYQSFRS